MRTVLAATWGGCALAACGFAGGVLTAAPGDGGRTLPQSSVTSDAGAEPESGSAFALSSGQQSACELVLGEALCWGSNEAGTIGTGDTVDRAAATPVDTPALFGAIAVGDQHTCAIDLSGNVECWGGNAFGQLGLGDTVQRTTPTLVTLAAPALAIATGYEFTCAVLRDHSLWCWGQNTEGQLGLNDAPGAPDAITPAQTGTSLTWVAVSGGQGHACGIQLPGTLWCWGRNSAGELGLGPGEPVQLRTPTQVGTGTDWVSLDLGQDQSCAIRHDGTLWCWGDDTGGALGLALLPEGGDAGSESDGAAEQEAGDDASSSFGAGAASSAIAYLPRQSGTDTDWSVVSTGVFHGCGLKIAGTLFCWGRNEEGQLGLGDNVDRPTPTQVGTSSDWLSVSVGRFFTCAAKEDHSVYCAGANGSGQLGVGDENARNTLTAVIASP